MARGGDAWRAVPYCLHVLRQIPGDTEMRFRLAALYISLGLRTAALEQIGAMESGTRATAGVRALQQLAKGLANDQITAETRRLQCEANLVGVTIDESTKQSWLAAWVPTLGRSEYFRASDGNIVVRSTAVEAGDVDRAWVRFRNDAQEAAAFALPHLGPHAAGKPARPYTLEGIDPPFLFRRIARETPRQPDGYQPMVRVVQRDAAELLDGLSVAELMAEVASARIAWYVGHDATERLNTDLAQNLGWHSTGPCITLATVRSRCVPSAERAVAIAASTQAVEEQRLRERIAHEYAGRTMESMRATFAPHCPTSRPLRALIPTCRYSTFIQHASSDLAAAFRAAGHEARTLVEPDDHGRLSPIDYLRVVDEFRPDLIVLINYTRSHLHDVIPENMPFVGWYQDSMPHQFNKKIGQSHGRLDFLIGHLHAELFEQYGYPDARHMNMPMVVSDVKFHAAPVSSRDAAEYACEIAYVSHHSETPQRMHARLMREAGTGTLAARVFEGLYERVQSIAQRCGTIAAYEELRRATKQEIERSCAADPAGHSVTQVFRQYCLPLADRIVRHQTLGWAADIAERRGWRLHLYGRGWEAHPRFGRYAHGELPHDESLRAAYQCAALHLHATINTPVHQRVMEGAMSGGLVACRLHQDAIGTLLGAMYDAAIDEAAPDMSMNFAGYPGYAIADSPTAMRLLGELQRLGAVPQSPRPAWVFASPEMLAEHETSTRRLIRAAARLGDIVGEMSEVTFRNETELEHLAERAITNHTWRSARSRMVADRVRAGMTHDVLAQRIVTLVHDGLGLND